MDYALAGLTLGLAAGIRLGPLGFFVIEQTMRYGPGRGFIVSLAPFITDGPIIALATILSTTIDDQKNIVALISILGSLYIAYLSTKMLFYKKNEDYVFGKKMSGGLFTSIKINILNPSPYLFWFSIGSSYIALATKLQASIFVISVLSSLCLTNFSFAFFVNYLGVNSNFITRSTILKILTLPMIYFSIKLLMDGIDMLWR